MLNNVVLFAQTCESEYKHSTFNEEFKVTKSSSHHSVEGFPEVEAVCTKYASNIISEQMKLATTVDYVITQREKVVEVTSPNQTVCVVTPGDHSSCTCTFYKTMFMPCRHIFATRRLLHLPLFQPSMVPLCWIKQYQLSMEENQSNNQVSGVQISTFTRKALPTSLSRSQKYTKMMNLCQKLATVASQCGMLEFRKKFEDVQCIVQCWEQNKSCSITEEPIDVSIKPRYVIFSPGPHWYITLLLIGATKALLL